MRFRSLKSQLTWAYVVLALLTVSTLGGVMFVVLSAYYAGLEQTYLRAAYKRVMVNPPRRAGTSDYSSWSRLAALEAQVRVQLVGSDGTTVADSGSPDTIDPQTLEQGAKATEKVQSSAGLVDALAGSASAQGLRSGAALAFPITGYGLPKGTMLILSEGPTSGSEVLANVTRAWVVAAVLAVLISILLGRLMAARIARPVAVLTEASDRMARGDLHARAEVHRDDEVGRLATSFNEMADRTETTVTTLRRFVGDAAHEIGTPLTALQADLELAETSPNIADSHRLVGRALGQTRRLTALVRGLVRLSRIEAADQATSSATVDVAGIVRESAEAVASRAEQAGLDLVLRITPEPVRARADRDELLSVVGGLLENAVKFTPEGGTITLACEASESAAVIRVSDTGIGVPSHETEIVFERFHRAANAAGLPGSGLGLAIARASIERIGGAVVLESDGAHGTTVTVSLPLA